MKIENAKLESKRIEEQLQEQRLPDKEEAKEETEKQQNHDTRIPNLQEREQEKRPMEEEQDNDKLILELQEKVREYEEGYYGAMKYISGEKEEAADLASDVKEIVISGAAAEEKWNAAAYRFSEYVKRYNSLQERLRKNYEELGRLLEQMPLKVEELFPEQPAEILHDEKIRYEETTEANEPTDLR